MARTRSQRQADRTARQQTRQTERSTRQGVRQSKRAERQKTRQEQRTQRTYARQATKSTKHQQKGASGYWTPEGTTARYQGIQGLAETGVDAAIQGAGAYMTGGASLGGQSVLEGLGGFFGGGDTAPPMNGGGYFEEVAIQSQPEQWYQNPMILGAAALGGLGLIYLGTRK